MLRFTRHYTTDAAPVYEQVRWKRAASKITEPDGTVVFEMNDVEVPEGWSQVAVDVLAQKYLRKAGVPSETRLSDDVLAPGWLTPSVAAEGVAFGGETSAAQVFHRMAGCWAYWGWRSSYFREPDARVFYDEIYMMLARQVAAPNSPQWFNTGLSWAYGIVGEGGQWVMDREGVKPVETPDAYARPQVHACFINRVEDNLVGEAGIYDLLAREARIFKYGSGAGSNFSMLRGKNERLSGGGVASGLISFLEVLDRGAGAIQSGGTTRRAAKMIVVDADHPEIEDFIAWKPREEAKAAAMAVGSRVLAARAPGTPQAMLDRAAIGMEPAVYDLGWECEPVRTVSGQNANNTVRLSDDFMRRVAKGSDWPLTARTTGEVVKTIEADDLWRQICRAAWACADPGLHFADTINAWHTCPQDGEILSSNPCCFPAGTYVDTSEGFIDIAELEQRDARGEVLPHAYGFNRDTEDFAWGKIKRAWVAGETANLVEVRTQGGQVIRCTPEHRWLVKDSDYVEASKLAQGMELLSTLTGSDRVVVVRSTATVTPVTVYDLEVEGCHNFGVRMDDTLGGDSLIVSNSEYFFLDETACNLASLRLTAFQDVNMFGDGGVNLEAFEHAARLWTIVLDISVSMASYPAAEIARGSYNYRTLGLGYCDLGGMLARLDLRYDSDHGRALAAGLTALMTGVAYRTSAELAAAVGPFPRYEANADDMRRVLRNHAKAVYHNIISDTGYADLNVAPAAESSFVGKIPADLLDRAVNAWRAVLSAKVFRNAQVSLLAPTGTISLVMTPAGHQVTSGVEPYFSPLTVKSLAGGGEMNFAANVRDEDCAVSARPLSAAAHVRMVAAVQPYLSGAVSKTINLPNHATVADVAEVYALAHRLGLKAVALYRDGSKLNQPLTTGATATSAVAQPENIDLTDIPEASVEFFEKARLVLPSDRPGGSPLPRGVREYLPWRRDLGFRQKVKIDGQTIFISFSEYPDGRPGEMFLDLAHEGSTLRGMANCLAMAVSLGLQSGVPAAKFAELFRGARFEPAGVVEGHDRIKMASSIPDYLGRELAITYCGDDDAGQVVPAVAVDTGQAVVALDQRAVRLAAGRYTGDICPGCHNATMEPAGKCLRCVTCGETSGCG